MGPRSAATGPFYFRGNVDGFGTLCSVEDIMSGQEWGAVVAPLLDAPHPRSLDEIRYFLKQAVWEGITERRYTADDWRYHREVAESLLAPIDYILGFHDMTRVDVSDFGGPAEESWVSSDWIVKEYADACQALVALKARVETIVERDDARKTAALTSGGSRRVLAKERFFWELAGLWAKSGLEVNTSSFVDWVEKVQVVFDPHVRLKRSTLINSARLWRESNNLPPLRGRQKRFLKEAAKTA